MALDGSVSPVGFVRDAELGQTYAVVRRASDGRLVRVWVSGASPLVTQVPWQAVNTQFTVGAAVLSAIPLDDQHPAPRQVVRRFDGGDGAIYFYDPDTKVWRWVTDLPTFQTLGLYWCDVTAADGGMFERMRRGDPVPAAAGPVRGDYPSCRPAPAPATTAPGLTDATGLPSSPDAAGAEMSVASPEPQDTVGGDA
ncbi:MAG: hypothetical protein AVDCRST_MAG77-4455 [uncultured Chloroflexi bacterium]|uniref:Uncharacterized protein n=1 Tax=uncultured Chloroflexota bacterium TaxID=166587 RepID=A0A6J4JUB5_9CHLR|nr:MAG: hypothetical protein AVDCRST_MAG77-4455 [uncultured Chloroflexota bacterium]